MSRSKETPKSREDRTVDVITEINVITEDPL